MFGWIRNSRRHPEVRAEGEPRRMHGHQISGRRPSRLADCVGSHLRVTGLLFVALGAVAAISPAAAQHDYPNRAITLVIPLPPGGTNDIMARAVADKLSAALGQQVVIENRPSGGTGTVGTRAVAKGP